MCHSNFIARTDRARICFKMLGQWEKNVVLKMLVQKKTIAPLEKTAW